MSTQIVLTFPSDLPEASWRDPEILAKGKQIIVLELLRKGRLTLDRAAELLEIDRNILSDLMAQYKVPGIETTDEASAQPTDPTTTTAGAWEQLLDCEGFEKEVYKSRRHSIRPEVQL